MARVRDSGSHEPGQRSNHAPGSRPGRRPARALARDGPGERRPAARGRVPVGRRGRRRGRHRAGGRHPVRGPAPRARRRAWVPEVSWSSARARSRSRRGPIGWRSWLPPRPAIDGRLPTTGSPRTPSRSAASRRSPPSPTCPPTTPSRAGWPRSPVTAWTTCAGAGGWRSTSIHRSTSCSSAMGVARRSTWRPSRIGWTRVRAVAADRRAELVLAGRTSATTLAWLERHAAARTRAWVEERGLRAASRLAQGDRDAGGTRPDAPQRRPASLLGALLERDGPGIAGRPARPVR